MTSASIDFFPGIHQPGDAKHFDRACISIVRLLRRIKPVGCAAVLVDSGAFSELFKFGHYRHSVGEYAANLYRLYTSGAVNILAAVAQDYMCEPFIVQKTGLSVDEHQRLTVERYDALIVELKYLFGASIPFHIMPVLQGYSPQDYVNHIRMYGDRLKAGMWVGVGSVCKRQGNPRAILSVLQAIVNERPDLKLHGFGVKITALMHPGVREFLSTADSMAWSHAARKQGRDSNDWREAKKFTERVNGISNQKFKPWQMELAA